MNPPVRQSGTPVQASLLLLMLALPGAVLAQSASDWLVQMSDAMRSLAYEGTLVYEHGDDMKTMSLVHGVIDGVEHERLSSLAGKPMEIIRNGDRVVCLWPETNKALITDRRDELLPVQLPRDMTTIPETYQGSVGETDQMTGRSATTLLIEPVDQYRYGYRLWLETESGLLLRSDVIAPDGDVVERLMFTDLRLLDSVAPEHFQSSYGDIEDFSEVSYGTARRESEIEDPEWVITDPPPGFMAISHNRDHSRSGHVLQHSVLSDGLASVSVFIEANDGSAFPLHGIARMGAVNAYGRQVEGHMITAVGEVPVATVQRIALSIRRDD